MTEKVFGYILLVIGVTAIVFSVVNIYRVFTKKVKPVQLFNFNGISLNTSQMVTNSLPPEFSELTKDNEPAPKTELISAEMINTPSNVVAHLLLMGFIASAGYKLASLGATLVRPIIVKASSGKKLRGLAKPKNEISK